MPLQRSTLDCMPCFAISFPMLGIAIPSDPFCNRPHLQLLRFPLDITIPWGPSCTTRSHRYSHTSPAPSTRHLPGAFLVSEQVVPYQTSGDTCCPRVSTL
jgi:hypothetical protein